MHTTLTHIALTFEQIYLFRNAIDCIWLTYAESSTRWKKLIMFSKDTAVVIYNHPSMHLSVATSVSFFFLFTPALCHSLQLCPWHLTAKDISWWQSIYHWHQSAVRQQRQVPHPGRSVTDNVCHAQFSAGVCHQTSVSRAQLSAEMSLTSLFTAMPIPPSDVQVCVSVCLSVFVLVLL